MVEEESLYSAQKDRNTERLNTGYDYRNKIMLSVLDNNAFNNKTFGQFIIQVEKVVNSWIRTIKSIKKSVDYLVPIDDDSIN
jgi:hypothetical protein